MKKCAPQYADQTAICKILHIIQKAKKPIISIIITNTNKTFLCSSSTNNSITQLVINIFLANFVGGGG